MDRYRWKWLVNSSVSLALLGCSGCSSEGDNKTTQGSTTLSGTSEDASTTTESTGDTTGSTGQDSSETTSTDTTEGPTSEGPLTDTDDETETETETDGPDPCVVNEEGLLWPLDCRPGDPCWVGIGHGDIDNDGVAFDCGAPGYVGHEGDDLQITEASMIEGVLVRAAADAQVVFVHDTKHDRCDIDLDHPDCVAPPDDWFEPGQSNGYRICTESSPDYCPVDTPGACFWCFDGGNMIVLEHLDGSVVFATRYDHIRQDSAMVEVGDLVSAGDPIAFVASAGRSTAPHLHFEVWDSGGWYSLTEPWSGECSPAGHEDYLFALDPAWCL